MLLSALNNSSSGTVTIFLDFFLHPRVYTRIQFVVQVAKNAADQGSCLINAVSKQSHSIADFETLNVSSICFRKKDFLTSFLVLNYYNKK